jgi:cellulose synthase/poly-beta-1,6-N-acetylglucosamine synthase-like glycosyltransferase
LTWLDTLFIPVAVIYLMVVAALFVYGINFYYLAWHAWRRRGALVEKPPPMEMKTLPRVTVQLPIYNEWYVAGRLITAAASLDYPRDLLEIQVLDDSTDDTVSLVARTVGQLKQMGMNIHHLHRAERHGYKATRPARWRKD